MECKVKYFLSYYTQLALKHILIIFITSSRECHANTPCFLYMPTGKSVRAQTKEVVVNVYEYFEELGRRKRTEGSLKGTSDATKLSRTSIKRLRINLIVLMTISCRHSQSSFFVERFFSKPWWLYSCLKSQKTIPGYYFNNCYKIRSVYSTRTGSHNQNLKQPVPVDLGL